MKHLLRYNVPLAPYTTLELGGSAEFFIKAMKKKDIYMAVDWAKKKNCLSMY